jgi:hypothetical protein
MVHKSSMCLQLSQYIDKCTWLQECPGSAVHHVLTATQLVVTDAEVQVLLCLLHYNQCTNIKALHAFWHHPPTQPQASSPTCVVRMAAAAW